MKFYADLHVCSYLGEPEHAERMVRKSAELGYDAVGVSFAAGATQEEIQAVKQVCNDLGVDLVTRMDLTPKSTAEMLRALRKVRGRFEVISVRCYSKAVARQAAKDRRVDLVSFPSTNPRSRFFDSAEAQLASKAVAALEVDMVPILSLEGLQRGRFLSHLRKEVLIAGKLRVPVVLSSGANDPSLLRRPEDLASLCYLFGMYSQEARQAVSENPKTIIARNRRKLSPDYVAPGVYLIRRGKDCPGA